MVCWRVVRGGKKTRCDRDVLYLWRLTGGISFKDRDETSSTWERRFLRPQNSTLNWARRGRV
ncbi:hypothetical protein MPNT_20143 [Candidatus Methylacidithermus pantelleriae]|uniref:Uncharacterized protein n=1 Tax=Candidatus Methylacidithermus pantelleriae TaxID=2744239 RepID=A0A8J2BSX1_9BACT|nr:hypothetical protein MPNT_20143 [Candidatus Methylacidithermus pantelleriae]